MPSKVKNARICLLIQAWFLAVGAALFIIVYGIAALGAGAQGYDAWAGMFLAIGVAVTVIMGGLGALLFYTARGIREQKNWARIVGIVIGALDILNVPIGTILGIFILIGLLGDEGSDWFAHIQSDPQVQQPPVQQ